MANAMCETCGKSRAGHGRVNPAGFGARDHVVAAALIGGLVLVWRIKSSAPPSEAMVLAVTVALWTASLGWFVARGASRRRCPGCTPSGVLWSLRAQLIVIVSTVAFPLAVAWVAFKRSGRFARAETATSGAPARSPIPGSDEGDASDYDSTWLDGGRAESPAPTGNGPSESELRDWAAAVAAREYEQRQRDAQRNGIPNTPWKDFKRLW